MSQRHELTNTLNQQIISHWHQPAGQPSACVIIAPAVGIEQSYYQDFAAWLAEQGYLAVTFDYFGVGQSLIGSLKKVANTALDWAVHDCSTVLNMVKQAYPELKTYWIGHSLGGQIIPFIKDNQRIDKIVTVACGSGYWKTNDPKSHRKALMLWHILVPTFTALYGYFPGKRLKLIGDLPPNVARQWRKWCLNPRYAAGAVPNAQALYSQVTQPLTSIAFSDDEMITETNVHALNSSFDQAQVNFKKINPKDFGAPRVGHLGFFRNKFRDSLWSQVLPELV